MALRAIQLPAWRRGQGAGRSPLDQSSRATSSRGQIVIPSLFALPSLFLFVFLIFEVAKLSREKIRHQFALDSAAFIEMTNYSDFLNRSAYVNGAFPMRIFKEGFGPGIDPNTGQPTSGTMIDRKDSTSPKSLYDILYENGAFPRTEEPEPLDPLPVWHIEYGGPFASERNKNPPDVLNTCSVYVEGGGKKTFPNCLEIISADNAKDYWVSWDDAKQIYELYFKIFSLLGSVEEAQFSVFCRLTGASGCPAGTGSHNFFRRSYWLNTGGQVTDAAEGAKYFDLHEFRPKPYCVPQVVICGNKPSSNAFMPYDLVCTNPPTPMPSTIQGCSPEGLFQILAVPQTDLRRMRSVNTLGGNCAMGASDPGYQIVQHYKTWVDGSKPPNFFNVNFDSLMEDGNPCVHATISLGGGRVWPDPTPKFQTKLYP
ncbi:MAG: hypothetical protein HY551_01245 [Elusimicrobia bacterium]|nr:hypothetical protein [Elusimicrobiota bacterium]